MYINEKSVSNFCDASLKTDSILSLFCQESNAEQQIIIIELANSCFFLL